MVLACLAALALLAPAAAHAAVPAKVPATVVVAFDQERITPLIAEGTRNRESAAPTKPNDPVRIASISKLIMALAVLRLYDEGRIAPDADISDYLGWRVRSPHHPEAKVTLAQLLSHRSGLSDAAGYIVPLGESLAARLADPASWRADAPPGKAPFHYANLGAPVIATVLEAATGERYDRLLERTVFAPLGVRACLNWVGCPPDFAARVVGLYRHTSEPARDTPGDLPPACTIPVAEGTACSLEDYVPGTNASVFSPQGGVRIGMVDLARIGQRLAAPGTGGFLSAQAQRWWRDGLGEAIQGQEFFCAMAAGLQQIPAPGGACRDDLFADGRPRIGHSGEAYGLQSGLWFDPVRGDGFAFFRSAAPPPPGGEDTGGVTADEQALIARARALLQARLRP